MHLKKIVFILLCSLFIFGCSQQDSAIQDTQGNSIQLSKLQGKWVVINYWASWCHSCVKEIPELNHFASQNKEIVLLGVNYDNLVPEDLKTAVEKAKITFPVLLKDPNPIWHLGEIGVVPTTFIINPQGKVVKVIQGQTSEKLLQETLSALQV